MTVRGEPASARGRTALLVNLAMVVEQANEQVLPAVYLFVGRSLNATPVQLGTLTLCRAMVQTLASPLSGILGDRYDRVLVLSSGAFIWGIMTSAMALTATLHQAMAFAGLNGLGLALLVPCCQSLIADLYPAEQRGRAFGTLQLTASLGGMLGGVFATNMGGQRPLGIDGWRAAFHTIAALSLLVGSLTLMFAADPRRWARYQLLPCSDVASSLLPDPGSNTSSPGTATPQGTSSPGLCGAGAGAAGLGGVSASALLDRRRSMQAHPTHSGMASSGSGGSLAKQGGGSRAEPWRHGNGWHALEGGVAHDDDTAPADDSGAADTSSSSTALLHRPQHMTLAVNGQPGCAVAAGEQLLLHTAAHDGGYRPPLRSPGQLQQRLSSPSFTSPSPSPPHHGAAPEPGCGGPDKPLDTRGLDKTKRRSIAADIGYMLRIKTFQAIVLQGIVGCFPWQAMVFFTLWLQLNGFTDTTASLLVATFGAGVAGGALLGGAVGDRMAQRLPNSGRIFTAQFSVLCGIPLTWAVLKGLPASSFAATPAAYGCLMFVMGLTCTWAGAGCNSPIFAEIVPDELRSTIYAFDRSFENSIAACAAPVVGLLAERAFGFSGVLSDDALADGPLRRHNAAALGSSLLACMALPWSLCLVFYTALHWFYPADRARALRMQRAAAHR